MRRYHLGFLAATLPVLALSLFLAGCGGGDKTDNTNNNTTTDKKADDSKVAKVEWKGLEPGKGVLKGTVTVDGKVNADVIGKMNTEITEQINKNANKDFCLTGSVPRRISRRIASTTRAASPMSSCGFSRLTSTPISRSTTPPSTPRKSKSTSRIALHPACGRRVPGIPRPGQPDQDEENGPKGDCP